MPKFSSLDADSNPISHDYGDRYFRQPCGNSKRLVVGPTSSHIKLLDELAATYPTQHFFLLYILLLSHAGRKPGRYQSPLIEDHEDLQLFLWRFQGFFEEDGRHHLWIGSPDSGDLLVYDQHNVLFAYGNLDTFEAVLKQHDFTVQEFWLPSPHTHSFDPANVETEDELMGYFDWQYFDLHPDDEWD